MGHLSLDQIQQKLDQAQQLVEVGALYVHYKDAPILNKTADSSPESNVKFYVIEHIGLWEANEEVCVVYRALYGKGVVWVRTIKDFTAEVETKNGKLNRFLKVD